VFIFFWYKVKLKAKAFTMIELIVVVTIIWILALWMTIYLDWTWDRAKNIEAESCAKSILWNMNNFLYYTLTSKTLKDHEWNEVSPNYYTIQLSWWNSNWSACNRTNFTWSKIFCNEIVVWYLQSGGSAEIIPYTTYTVGNTCQQNNSRLWLYRSGNKNISYVKMNKWFSPLSLEETNVFFITTDDPNEKLLYDDIIVMRCNDNNCRSWKELWKFEVDARTQTITYSKCKFYKEDAANECLEREG
jgi:prepilin-type N-terminal cleavage/methylation domain-containing protein